MKKILLSVVCLVMVGIQSVQAQVAIAALHHNDSVKIYSAAGIKNAIDDAVAGDTIYLSEGIFGGFTVAKPIAIIGAGQTTNISGKVNIGYSNTDSNVEAGLLLSGLNIIQGVSFNRNINGARITQCKIAGTCDLYNSSSYIQNDIEILMSQIETLSIGTSVKGLTVVASKITKISGNGADEGSVTILNCNVKYSNTANTVDYNNLVNCIIGTAGGGVYQNCLYGSISNSPVLYDCYQNSDFTLDDDLNCSLTDDELKTAGYVGPDNTWVGINGGEVKFSLVMPVVQVTEHSVEVDQAERKLKVSLKLGNK